MLCFGGTYVSTPDPYHVSHADHVAVTDCNDNKMQVPDFPWPDFKPVFDDPSDSDSLVFIRWLETEKAKQGTTPTETQIDIKGSSRTPRHFVPDLEMRQRAWNDIQGNAELIPPVCGPFELQLPPWFDFKAQVWGPQGIELKRINNELIDEKLKVTWGVGDREPGAPAVVDRLIVGFSKATDAKAAFRPSTLVSLSTLWRAVCIWGASMYEGRSRTLVRHLEVAMKVHIGIDLDHLPNGGGPVISAYTAAEEDVNAVKKKTDEHKEALVALRDEVLKLAEDGCTTAKLGFWALQGNVDDAETALARIDVAEQVWETACSGARDVMKVLEKTEEARRAVLLMTSTT